ncbi:MAG: 23S rRNA (adenine(2030)-N(6))-methyltransferase RlmJ [Panacagrimonas sp.]
MHYRHVFHAGNFADVFKHVLLVGLLEGLRRKDKPWFYLDTHAGAGRYDLASHDADRTGEWRDGIGRLERQPGQPELVTRYLDLVNWPAADAAQLRHSRVYPGSPQIAVALARMGDRVACCESVADVAAQLRAHLFNAEIHVRNGYDAYGLLPPREKRGLVLLDPPFESRDEFDKAGDFVQRVAERFASGMQAVWYPLKNRHDAARFTRRAARDTARATLVCSLDTGAPGEGQMRACGMLVVNPPFGFEAQAREALAWLAPRLAQGPRPQWSVDAGA